MPKMKTRRCAAKRFRVTGTGKIKRAHAKRRHNFHSRNAKSKRQLAAGTLVAKPDEAQVKRLIPYKF